MAVWYLDNDDEITDAAARLRSTTDEQVVFVVPPGARIATGRINFKLLAREARSRDIALAVASPDEQVRSLAAAAGVLTLPTADEAEAALQRGDEPPEPSPTQPTPDGDAVIGSADTRRAVATRTRRRRLSIAVVFVLAIAVVGGVASLESFSTAEITLTPNTMAIAPIAVTITALTSVTEPDSSAAEVPAVAVPFVLEVAGEFDASGRQTTSAKASGEVEFGSAQQSFDQDIVAGTRVRTPAGIDFQTTEAVVLPRPAAGTGASTVSAPVEAVEAGPEANVPPSTITVVPSLESQGISVSNTQPTSGGDLHEATVVTAADYDASTVDLQNRLAGKLASQLRDPAGVPEGLTLFAETARLDSITYDPPAEAIVGQAVDTFSLQAMATATALAVDEGHIQEIAAASLLDQLPNGLVVLPASIEARSGEALVDGNRIVFSSAASADAYELIDPDALAARIAGLPVSEAQAILEAIGTTTVNVWPDLLGDLPGDPARITLDVMEPFTTE